MADGSSVPSGGADIDAARISLGSGQTISTGTQTTIAYGSNDIEDTSIYTVDTANNQITITQDGRYYISAVITFDGSTNWSTGDSLRPVIREDTNARSIPRMQHGGANDQQSIQTSVLIDVTANSNITVDIEHTSGSDETLSGDGRKNYLEVMKVSA